MLFANTARHHECSVHTTREHGPSLPAVLTGIKSVVREQPVDIRVRSDLHVHCP